MTLSDNTAGNLMLASFGGPEGLTAFVRTLGDPVTRLDRIETALNEGTPGDPRDTTSPLAMLGTMQKLVAGDALSAASRERLVGWAARLAVFAAWMALAGLVLATFLKVFRSLDQSNLEWLLLCWPLVLAMRHVLAKRCA